MRVTGIREAYGGRSGYGRGIVVGNAGRAAVCALAVSLAGGASACGSRLPRPASVASTTVAPTTVVVRPSPTTSPPTTVAPVPGPPYAVSTVTLRLVDTSRPTVSNGREISPSRALTTLVWLP